MFQEEKRATKYKGLLGRHITPHIGPLWIYKRGVLRIFFFVFFTDYLFLVTYLLTT